MTGRLVYREQFYPGIFGYAGTGAYIIISTAIFRGVILNPVGQTFFIPNDDVKPPFFLAGQIDLESLFRNPDFTTLTIQSQTGGNNKFRGFRIACLTTSSCLSPSSQPIHYNLKLASKRSTMT